MRRIDLTNYTVCLRNDKGEWTDLPYEVKDSMIELIFSRDLRLSGRELLIRDTLAHKISDCSDGSILLEEDEWNKFVTAIETIQGLGRPDVELTHRILEAPRIKVEEKK